jgi:8-oxo-dGTP pyrophosphatase MutT (NUDIX family)
MIEISTLYEAAKFAIGSLAWAKKHMKKDSEYAIPRLHDVVNRKNQLIRIHQVIYKSPTVSVSGNMQLPAEVIQNALTLRPELELNERHAIAESWDGTNVDTIRTKTCDFADLLALREYSKKENKLPPKVLSSGAVVICPSMRCILLHRRSDSSATYPNALHILGGAFKPPEKYKFIDNPGDRMSLEFTMVREVFEESGLIVRRYQEPICVMQELDTGFIQYVHLGVRVTKEQFHQLSQNSEGDLIRLPYDELSKTLMNEQDWVPTGRAQILMWLGLGAPGAGWHAKFDKMSAKEVFGALVK